MKNTSSRFASGRLRRRGLGLTLVELMVAITIGLLVILLSISAYLTMSRSSVGQDEISRVEQGGRFALEQIVRTIRMAGYRDWNEAGVLPPGYTAVSGLPPSLGGTDGAQFDSITIRYYGSNPATAGGVGAAAATVLDCYGQQINTATRVTQFITGTTVAGNPAGVGALTCDPSGAGTAVQTLAANIERVQFLYGVDTNGDEQVDRFVSATTLATPAQWDQVVAVRVALVVSGNAGSATAGADTNTYQLFGGTYADGTDLGAVYTPAAGLQNRIRRVFTQTVRLRNFGGVNPY